MPGGCELKSACIVCSVILLTLTDDELCDLYALSCRFFAVNSIVKDFDCFSLFSVLAEDY